MLTQATLLLPLLAGMNLISPFGCDLASWSPFSSLPLWRIKEKSFNGTTLGSRLASCGSWLAVRSGKLVDDFVREAQQM